MSQVTLSWAYPTPAANQRAIKGAQVYVRVKGASAYELLGDIVPFPATSLIDDNVDDGDWEYQATTVDVANKESTPLFASVTVASGPPAVVDPSPLTSFGAAQTG